MRSFGRRFGWMVGVVAWTAGCMGAGGGSFSAPSVSQDETVASTPETPTLEVPPAAVCEKGEPGTLPLWTARSGQTSATSFAVARGIDVRHVAVVAPGGEIGVFELANGALSLSASLSADVTGATYGSGPECRVALDRDATRIAIGDEDGGVSVHALPSGERLAQRDRDGRAIVAIAVSDDGRWVAFANVANEVTLWNVEDGQTTAPREFPALELAFIPGTHDLVLGGTGFIVWTPVEEVQRWNESSGWLEEGGWTINGVRGLAVTSDGESAVLAGYQSVTRIDLEDREAAAVEREVPLHEAVSIAIAPDGESFATIGDEGTLRLWATRTLTEIGRTDVALQIGVGYFAAGSGLFTVGRDGTLHGFGCPE